MKAALGSIGLLLITSASCLQVARGIPLYEKNNTDSYLNTLQIIRKYGYPAESHLTRTQDGYLLELHRIPYGRDGKTPRRRPPVLLQHGLLGSSADFILVGPQSALPFLLADAGYDVWLGNMRGNTYSRAHETFTPDDLQFWDFSWHESGLYDVPAEIDFICNYTRQDDLIYVGYSMGTTEFFVLTSSRPEYQRKVRMAALLAAVAYLQNTRTPLRYLAPLANDLQVLSELLTDGELIQQSTLYRYLVRFACTLNNIERQLCRNMVFLYTGSDPFQFNETLIPSILNHIPAGASTKSVTHFAQLIQSGKFQQFDYGAKQNLVRYNSTQPPGYDLEGIRVPLYLFEGPNDFLSTQEDVTRLVGRLPNANRTTVSYSHFNHLDFVLARDVKALLYDRVMEVMERFADDAQGDSECAADCDYDYET